MSVGRSSPTPLLLLTGSFGWPDIPGLEQTEREHKMIPRQLPPNRHSLIAEMLAEELAICV